MTSRRRSVTWITLIVLLALLRPGPLKVAAQQAELTSSVVLMRTNHLADALRDNRFGIGIHRMRPGEGFGYDVAVFDDPGKAGGTTGKGTYLRDGLAGTWFRIDPAKDIVFVGMIQRIIAPDMPNLQDLSRTLVQQVLLAP